MEQKYRSRQDALLIGVKYYYPLRPCPSGGVAKRLASSGQCLCDLCRPRVSARRTANRLADLDRRRAAERVYFRAYYARKSERILATNKRWRDANPESVAAALARRIAKDPEGHRAGRNAYVRRWAALNQEVVRARARRKRARRPELFRSRNSSRRAARLQRVPGWFGELDQFICEEAFSLAEHRSSTVGGFWHVDHMLPLRAETVSGLHCGLNLQVIPAALNTRKGNRLVYTEPFEWMAHFSALSS